jgi:hypothetical protein
VIADDGGLQWHAQQGAAEEWTLRRCRCGRVDEVDEPDSDAGYECDACFAQRAVDATGRRIG